MPACEGCTQEFPLLDKDFCGICTKIAAAPQPITLLVRSGIIETPQCEACGVTYLHLHSKICNACVATATSVNDVDLTEFITARAADFTKQASQHRINQIVPRAQNAGLQAAAQINMKAANLCKTSKAEVLTVSTTLWSMSRTGGAVKKLLPLNMTNIFNTKDNADTMFSELLAKAKDSYDTSPTTQFREGIDPSFDCASVTFGIVKAASNVNEFDQKDLNTTVGELYGTAKSQALLSEKDSKNKTLTLRIMVVESQPVIDEGEDVFPEITVPRRTKRKLSDKASAVATPSAKHYQSSYRPKAILVVPMLPLEYVSHHFKRTTFEVNSEGAATRVYSDKVEIISVAKDWQLYRKGDVPYGGYLGKGLSKCAFEARMGNTRYALLQSKAISSCEVLNKDDLTNELALLSLGQYFMEAFYERAKFTGVKGLPEMCWNVSGAFIGELEAAVPRAPINPDDDCRSLLFSTFLATAVLPSGPLFTEEKFSGNDEAGKNSGGIGEAVDAFAHHVVVSSQGTVLFADLQGVVGPQVVKNVSVPRGSVIFFDPQAHMSNGNSGHWDNGPREIKNFIATHKCNKVCHAMDLDTETVEVPEPVNSQEPEHRGRMHIQALLT